jgi:hypothetical protein
VYVSKAVSQDGFFVAVIYVMAFANAAASFPEAERNSEAEALL